MLKESRVDRVYLAMGPTDLRKSIDGLSLIVQESFKLNPFSRHLFVFCNRKRDKIKILEWDKMVFGYITNALKKIHSDGQRVLKDLV